MLQVFITRVTYVLFLKIKTLSLHPRVFVFVLSMARKRPKSKMEAVYVLRADLQLKTCVVWGSVVLCGVYQLSHDDTSVCRVDIRHKTRDNLNHGGCV